MSYWGIYQEVVAPKNESIRVTADADKFVYIADATGYAAVFLCGVIINPCKFLQLFQYINHTNKLDYILNTTLKRSDTLKTLLLFLFIVGLNSLLFWKDISDSYQILGHKIGMSGVLYRYLPMDITACTSNVTEYTNQLLLSCFERKIKRLNELLKEEYLKMDYLEKQFLKQGGKIGISKHSAQNVGNKSYEAMCQKVGSVSRLNKAYLIMMDAADTVNDFLGPCTLLMVVSVFWLLIASSHFLILIIQSKRGESRNAVELTGRLALLFFHIFRLLLITEPTYACLVEAKKTKMLVCNLLCLKVGKTYRRQVKDFSLALELRQLRFSAFDLFVVDRSLLTSLTGKVANFVVILLEQHEQSLQNGQL